MTEIRNLETGLKNKVSIFFYFFISVSLSPFFYPLVSNLIFITAESLKQFTWSASNNMKIDNPEPPFLPGKQKWKARASLCTHAFCECTFEGARRRLMTPKMEVDEKG